MKRVIKRPVAQSGKHALLVSLFPLFCAASLLLSGCADRRNVVPPTETEDSGASPTAVDNVGTAEVSAPDLATQPLHSKAQAALNQLSKQIYRDSEELSAWERTPPETVMEIWQTAESWFDKLIGQTTQAQQTFRDIYGEYADETAPGLKTLLERLNAMLEFVQNSQKTPPPEWLTPLETPQEALAKLREWLDDLKERADALPADFASEPAAEPEPAADFDMTNEKLDDISGKLSDVLEAVNGLAEDTQGVSKEAPRNSLNLLDALSFFVLLAILGCEIYRLFADRKQPVQTTPNPVNATGQGQTPGTNHSADEMNAIITRLDGLDEMSKRLDALSSRINKFPQTPPPPPIQTPSKDTPPVKPEYFKVTNPTVADGQSIYLQKKSIRSELCGTPLSNDPKAYRISPAMSQTTDDGKRGVVSANVLYTGDIKRCFNFPKERPPGWDLYVTVEKPALIRQIGNNQYMLEKQGKLSVSSVS